MTRGRPRKNKDDNWLPPRTYRGKTSYEWHPKGGGAISLCKREDDESEALKAKVWQRYNEEFQKKTTVYNVNALVQDYFHSEQFKLLSVATQKDYRVYSKKVLAVMGKMIPREVKPMHVRAFMDKLAARINPNTGKKMTVSANRHHSFLSVVFGWGLERNHLTANPAKSVRKFREEPRPRYVTDDEYFLVYELAKKSGSPYIAAMMEIGYLCRLRPIETRNLTEKHLLDDGIFNERRKGSESEITAWSPRLQAAVDFARSLYPQAPRHISRPLIRGRNGSPITERAYKTAWKRLMTEALQGELTERFTLHDLKAKGVSDHEKKYGGHRDKKMQAVYNRTPNKQEPTR